MKEYYIPNSGVIKKLLFKIIRTNAVFDAEDEDYITLATCRNEEGKIETIAIDDFYIEDNMDTLEGAFLEIDVNDDYTGHIFK